MRFIHAFLWKVYRLLPRRRCRLRLGGWLLRRETREFREAWEEAWRNLPPEIRRY